METPRIKYLKVPHDELQYLTSPPCSPVPENWHTLTEHPPIPCIDDFDLDSPDGMVSLGDGRLVNFSKSENPKFRITRKGAIISKKSVLMVETEGRCSSLKLPVIIVDSYEHIKS